MTRRDNGALELEPPSRRSYDVYPLNVSSFYDLPPSLQNSLARSASGLPPDALPTLPNAESFEYMTREGQHVVRVHYAPQYIQLSPSADKSAVLYLTKLSGDAGAKKKCCNGRRTASTTTVSGTRKFV